MQIHEDVHNSLRLLGSSLLNSVHFIMLSFYLFMACHLIISFVKLCRRLPWVEIVLNLHYYCSGSFYRTYAMYFTLLSMSQKLWLPLLQGSGGVIKRHLIKLCWLKNWQTGALICIFSQAQP